MPICGAGVSSFPRYFGTIRREITYKLHGGTHPRKIIRLTAHNRLSGENNHNDREGLLGSLRGGTFSGPIE